MLIKGLELYLTIPFVMVLGISINLFFTFMNVNWANTPAQRSVAFLLPLIILIITKVISLNLALALGMIGALSIVRFRNPVKSPFELVTFFSFIAIGIAAAVDFRFALIIWFATIITPVGNVIISKTLPRLFSSSEEHFSETTLATFKVSEFGEKEKLMELIKSHEFVLHSFYESRNTGGDESEIEVTFRIEDVHNYQEIDEEMRLCAKVLSSAMQKY